MPEATVEEEIRCDVLVIGTEGTGARAAIASADRGADVLAVTKGQVARSGATLTADGEIDVDSRSIREVFQSLRTEIQELLRGMKPSKKLRKELAEEKAEENAKEES